MPLTATQKVAVAEITLETLDVIEDLATELTAEQETAIVADIATWNSNRNEVDLKFDSDRVNLESQRLLNAIRERVRKMLDLPLYSSEVFPGSVSIPVVAVF